MGDLVSMAEGTPPALATGSLTPALRQSLKIGKEAELTDEEFALVSQFASLPCPPAATLTAPKINEIITALALVLKSPPGPMEHGRLKLAIYRKALAKLSLGALQIAANRAIETLEWMPTPAELLRLAMGFEGDEQKLHARARVMRQRRAQRLHEEAISQIRDKALSDDDLQKLTPFTAQVAETQALVVVLPSGTILYRTAETMRRCEDERRAIREAEDPEDERLSRARDGGILEGTYIHK